MGGLAKIMHMMCTVSQALRDRHYALAGFVIARGQTVRILPYSKGGMNLPMSVFSFKVSQRI